VLLFPSFVFDSRHQKAKCVDILRGRDLLLTLSFRWTEAAGGGFQAVRQYPIPISNTGYLSSQVQRVDLDSNHQAKLK